MPELPEVESARLVLDRAMVGHKIVDVKVTSDKLVFEKIPPAQFKKAMLGAKVVGTDRRGKYFWLKLNRKPWPVIHFGMSGSSQVVPAHENFKKMKSICMELTLDNGAHIIFKDPRRFGRIRLASDPLKEGAVSKLGFDPLFNFPKARVLFEILQKRKAPIKAVLLDQSVFAGIGNWIADEVLFQARLSPHRLANALNLKEVTVLTAKILSVVKFAVKVRADHHQFPDTWLFHKRWSKGKRKILFAGSEITFDTVGGRTTAWLPDLQK
jgi:formamidopyrimidine-DNA glycosylase